MKKLTLALFLALTWITSSLVTWADADAPVFCKFRAREKEVVVNLDDFKKVGAYKKLDLAIETDDVRLLTPYKDLAILKSVFGTFLILEFTTNSGKRTHDIFESIRLDKDTLAIRQKDSSGYSSSAFSVRCQNVANKQEAEKQIDLSKFQKQYSEELKKALAERATSAPAKSEGASGSSTESLN